MTDDEIDKLDGRELDAAIHTKVLGTPIHLLAEPRYYSTDAAATEAVIAWLVSERGSAWLTMESDGETWDVGYREMDRDDGWSWSTTPDPVSHPSRLVALCRFALRVAVLRG